MFITYAISLVLIGLSGFMLDWHRRSWWAAEHDADLPDQERRFRRAQYRRRMQASGIIGALGAGIGIKSLVPVRPLPMMVYLLFLAGACACIMVLAGLDAWATRQYYARLRTEQLTAQIKLTRELNAARKTRDANG
jgi:hypothetical protein